MNPVLESDPEVGRCDVADIRKALQEHAYLIEDDGEIHSITRRGDRLSVTCGSAEAKRWHICMIDSRTSGRLERWAYPLMENGREKSFTEQYRQRWNQPVRTLAELGRFIRGFGLEDFAVYQDCITAGQFPGERETYSMNSFIEDEIRDTTVQKKLLLRFQPGKKEAWLQRDVASFLVSEVQRLYPEYDCGGVFV